MTTNALWDSRIVHEQRLIDVQYGGEIGLVARPFGEEQVVTPQGQVHASRYQMITPITPAACSTTGTSAGLRR